MRVSIPLLGLTGLGLLLSGCSSDGSTGAAGAPALPTVTVADLSVAEGSANHDESLTVTLTPAPTAAMTVKYRLRAGSAAAGTDWLATTASSTTGTLNFAVGESSKTVSVTIVGDATVEADETLYLDLFEPSTGLTLARSTATVTISNDDTGRLAKNIILIIGDGMNISHEIAGSRYIKGTDYGLSFHSFDYKTYVNTWDITCYNKYATVAGETPFAENSFLASLGYDVTKGGAVASLGDEPVARSYFLSLISGKEPATDSASAGTALACGRKTDDGNVAWKTKDPSDGAYTTIAELARAAGMKIGVVSTVPFNHATPACFVSHNKDRNRYKGADNTYIDYEIIRTVKPDVVIGGGHPTWETAYVDSANYTHIKAGGTANEYVFVERTASATGAGLLDAATTAALSGSKKLFGLFGGLGGNFEYYTVANAPGAPAFTQGSTENPTLAQCTTAALKVLTNNGTSTAGSFVMIEQGDIDWANHANHFPNMIGGMYDLDEAVKAAVAFVDTPGDAVDWNNTLIIVTADHSNSYMKLRSVMGKGVLPTVDANGKPTDGSVSYSTSNHTNEAVCLYAKGAGKDLFKAYEGVWYPGSRMIDNTHIFWTMIKAMALTSSVPAANSQNVPLAPTPVGMN